MKKINILLAADKNYLPYLEVALKSLLAHHRHLSVFILNHGDIPVSWVENIEPFFLKRASRLVLATLEKAHSAQFQSKGYISQSTYLRYYIEDLFQYSESPYWIYLDCDLIANSDITRPFAEMGGHTLMAVSDPYINHLPAYPYKTDDYFNAGVLYIHADHWHGVKNNLVQLTKSHQESLFFGDQDVLNLYFKEKWVKLDKTYNFQHDHFLQQEKTGEEITPKIIHFTGPEKPLSPSSANFSYAQSIIALFRLYRDISWEDLTRLPVGFLSLTLTAETAGGVNGKRSDLLKNLQKENQ